MSRMAGLAAIRRGWSLNPVSTADLIILCRMNYGRVYPGQRIAAPFGKANKQTEGYCVGIDIAGKTAAKKDKIKAYTKTVDDEPLLDAKLLELADWISTYYVCPLGQVLAAMLPAAVKKGVGTRNCEISRA